MWVTAEGTAGTKNTMKWGSKFCEYMWQRIPGKEKSKCEEPRTGLYHMCSRNSMEASVPGECGVSTGLSVGKWGQKVSGARWGRALKAMVRTLNFTLSGQGSSWKVLIGGHDLSFKRTVAASQWTPQLVGGSRSEANWWRPSHRPVC